MPRTTHRARGASDRVDHVVSTDTLAGPCDQPRRYRLQNRPTHLRNPPPASDLESERKESEPVKITVDRDKCIASGQCVLIAPENFDQDDDGIVVVIQPNALPD